MGQMADSPQGCLRKGRCHSKKGEGQAGSSGKVVIPSELCEGETTQSQEEGR